MAFVPLHTFDIVVGRTYATETHILNLIKTYESGSPGYGDHTRNHSLNNAINDFRSGFYDRADTKFLRNLQTELEYRLEVVKKADKLIDMLGLPRPGNSTCSAWDNKKWEATTGHAEETRWRHLRDFFERHYERLLFPTPTGRRETETYGKGGAFVFAALYVSGWSTEKIESRIIQILAQLISESAMNRKAMLRMIEIFRKEDEEEYENDDGQTWNITVTRATPKIIELFERKRPSSL
jgi:hypothetical protein